MHPKLFLFLGGLAAGVAGALIVISLVGGEDSSDSENRKIARLQGEVADRNTRIQDLERSLEVQAEEHRLEIQALEYRPLGTASKGPGATGPAAAREPEEVKPEDLGPPTMEEMQAALKEFGNSMMELFQGGDIDAEREKLRNFFTRAGPEEVAALLEKYKDSSDIMKKMLMAHGLAQSGNAQALDALKEIVTDQSLGFLDRRFASHGLAFVDDESLKPFLLEVAREDPDRGTRANSAFGVARSGDPEGLGLYAKITDEAFREKDSMALGYLGGFMLLGEKGLPYVRERLGSYKERQSRVLLIEMVKGHKDRESLPALQRIARDAEEDQSVREAAAEQAIRIIEDQRD